MPTLDEYFGRAGRDDVVSGGVRMVPIDTPYGSNRVWTKRVGNNPRVKVLLLHGGPGAPHQYLEGFDSFLPATGIEYYYYDQLGCGRSDRPDDALRHQQHLKALVVSNMMASIPAYNRYAEEVLMPTMDQEALRQIKEYEARGRTQDPRYEELLIEHHYVNHVLRMPVADWPEPVVRSFADINQDIYVPMQGPSELGASGKLADWDRTADLHRIEVPTLVIGAQHDTMDPAHLEWMAGAVQNGTHLHCPEGSHLAMYDDQLPYMDGLTSFLTR